MQKLIDLDENRRILQEELHSYQNKMELGNRVAGQDQKDIILRYVLMKTNVGDLYCQKLLLEEFTMQCIKENEDGNVISKVYLDFITAVSIIQSLDI